LSRAGFSDIEVRMIPVCGGAEIMEEWLTNYAPTYLTNFSEEKAHAGLKILDKIRNQIQEHGTYFYQVWFEVLGVKAN